MSEIFRLSFKRIPMSFVIVGAGLDTATPDLKFTSFPSKNFRIWTNSASLEQDDKRNNSPVPNYNSGAQKNSSKYILICVFGWAHIEFNVRIEAAPDRYLNF